MLPPPPSDTFYGQNSNKDYDSKEYNRERRSRTRSKKRSTSKSRDFRPRHRSPHHAKDRRDNSDKSSRERRNQNNRSGSTSISFHINGHGKSVFLIDTGAQSSYMGKCTFVKMEGNLKSLNKSENSYIFGNGPSSPSIGQAKINILDHVFSIDIVSRDIPGLIGMDILTSKYRNRNIFHLNLVDRQLTVDNEEEDIELLGDRQSHLHLPDNLITISSKFTGQSHLLTQTLILTQLIIRTNMYCVQTDPEEESFTSSDENDN